MCLLSCCLESLTQFLPTLTEPRHTTKYKTRSIHTEIIIKGNLIHGILGSDNESTLHVIMVCSDVCLRGCEKKWLACYLFVSTRWSRSFCHTLKSSSSHSHKSKKKKKHKHKEKDVRMSLPDILRVEINNLLQPTTNDLLHSCFVEERPRWWVQCSIQPG